MRSHIAAFEPCDEDGRPTDRAAIGATSRTPLIVGAGVRAEGSFSLPVGLERRHDVPGSPGEHATLRDDGLGFVNAR
jgi:hypothetical protein